MTLRSQLISGYTLVLALMVLIGGITYKGNDLIVDTHKRITDAHEVILKTNQILNLLIDMETGERGFVITGKEEFLEPYTLAKAAYEKDMAELELLVAAKSMQAKRLQTIDALFREWHKTAALPVIRAKRNAMKNNITGTNMEPITSLVADGAGKDIMDAIRQKTKVFINIEKQALAEHQKKADLFTKHHVSTLTFGTLIGITFGLATMLLTMRTFTRELGGEPVTIARIMEEIAQGNLDVSLERHQEKHTGILKSIEPMLVFLRESHEKSQKQDWLKTGVARLNEELRGDPDNATLASKVITEITTYLNAHVGMLYIMEDDDSFEPSLILLGSYAHKKRKHPARRFTLGEGLAGQAALEKKQIVIQNVPENYIKITSGLGEHIPRFIVITPFLYEDQVKGIVEIGTLDDISDSQLEYIEQVMPAVAIAFESSLQRTELAHALEASLKLSQELQLQQQELRTANEELEEQTRALKESEERLKAQQEELKATNEELEEKTDVLERQKQIIESANRNLEHARGELEKRARELELASQYKSEFLANMSHELRTPLNSLLILSSVLGENKPRNLTDDQLRSVNLIHDSGNNLLSLINEILDLSKIEAGRMELHMEAVRIKTLGEKIYDHFHLMAKRKNLALEVRFSDTIPPQITTDKKRFEQILRNLVGNAIKFTKKGKIRIEFKRPESSIRFSKTSLDSSRAIAVAVIDTGIGIAPEKQKMVFEAFQQADGSTARLYGGTGLGLSISRQLADLLGGEIHIHSDLGKGSTFTLYLPTNHDPHPLPAASDQSPVEENVPAASHEYPTALSVSHATIQHIPDDRDLLCEQDKRLLIIEDDPEFARLLLKECHAREFKVLVAPTGKEGLELAARYLPEAVILDIRLPGTDGWGVLEQLKDDHELHHIPVHIMSVSHPSLKASKKGIIGFVNKPVGKETPGQVVAKFRDIISRKIKDLLIVENDDTLRKAMRRLIGGNDMHTDEAVTGETALALMKTNRYDCIILNPDLPDMTGFKLLKILRDDHRYPIPPVVIHTGRNLSRKEEREIEDYAGSIIIKGIKSRKRLLDELSLFLHQVVAGLPAKRKETILGPHGTDGVFKDKTVLMVDDDMRNLFTLSRIMEDKGMNVIKAEDGQKALEALEKHPDVDLVLMDIMMPVMDGYETITEIRAQEAFSSLPIIALTAKAMPEDREKCIESGANDYMAKPINLKRMFSMLRDWLHHCDNTDPTKTAV